MLRTSRTTRSSKKLVLKTFKVNSNKFVKSDNSGKANKTV